MEKELELVENPILEQLKKRIHNQNIRDKRKTVYFKDFIKEIAKNSNDIIDAEIVKESIKVKVKNEEL